MTTIHIAASREYDVVIEPGLLTRLGTMAAELGLGRRAAVISDDAVFALYGAAAEKALIRHMQGYPVKTAGLIDRKDVQKLLNGGIHDLLSGGPKRAAGGSGTRLCRCVTITHVIAIREGTQLGDQNLRAIVVYAFGQQRKVVGYSGIADIIVGIPLHIQSRGAFLVC